MGLLDTQGKWTWWRSLCRSWLSGTESDQSQRSWSDWALGAQEACLELCESPVLLLCLGAPLYLSSVGLVPLRLCPVKQPGCCGEGASTAGCQGNWTPVLLRLQEAGAQRG
jgi:hypothetical protein